MKNRHAQQIDSLLGIRLSGTALAMKAQIAAAMEARGFLLTFDDWLSLLPIARSPGISQKELASRMGKDKTTVSRQLDSFERRRLVARRQSKEDARAIELSLTEKGLKLHEDAFSLIAEFDHGFAAGIAPEELELLEKILSRIRLNIQKKGKP